MNRRWNSSRVTAGHAVMSQPLKIDEYFIDRTFNFSVSPITVSIDLRSIAVAVDNNGQFNVGRPSAQTSNSGQGG
jgi:hypothetical protein